jgi:cystathionine beta-lyase/cystathionine gamma-synthase
MTTTTTFKSIDTGVIHAGEPQPRIRGAVAMPIFQSSTFIHEGATDYHATRYVRLNNTPNHEVLHDKLASIESGEAALVTASGMAAIATSLLAVLEAGDHLLAIDCPYGGTRNFLTEDLPRFGIQCSFVGGDDPDEWAAKRRPETKVIYMESITNPLMQVPDLPAVVDFAREHGLVSMIDNTLTSPVNFRPLEIGFDLSLHSATKYLNGHSDIAAGAVIGRRDLVRRVHLLANHLGGTLDPHACYLLHRGMKTMVLRVRRQNDSAIKIAKFLETQPAIEQVNYPGLPSSPGHARATELFDGYGGTLSFDFADGVEAAERFLKAVTIPLVAVSLGGVESLLIRPAATAYANVPADERARLGVTDGLVRMAVGIEEPTELINDLERALNS